MPVRFMLFQGPRERGEEVSLLRSDVDAPEGLAADARGNFGGEAEKRLCV